MQILGAAALRRSWSDRGRRDLRHDAAHAQRHLRDDRLADAVPHPAPRQGGERGRPRPAARLRPGAGQPRRVRQLPRRAAERRLRLRRERPAGRHHRRDHEPPSAGALAALAGERQTRPRRSSARARTWWPSRATSRRSAWARRRPGRPCRRSSPASCTQSGSTPGAGAARQSAHLPRRAPRARRGRDPGLRDHRPGGAVPHRQGHQRPARAPRRPSSPAATRWA